MTPATKCVLTKKLTTRRLPDGTVLSEEINIPDLMVPMLGKYWWRETESKIDANKDGVFLVLVFDKKEDKKAQ